MVISGTMWPVDVTGRPGIVTLQMCVDCTFIPSGRLIDMGFVARRLFCTLVSFITKTDVAPVSAMAWAGSIDMTLAICSMIGCSMVVDKFAAALTMSECCCMRFNAMTVLSSSLSTLVQSVVFGVGYNCI